MFLKQFGGKASGSELEKIRKSSHYLNGSFHNLRFTPMMSEEHSYLDVTRAYLQGGTQKVPKSSLPTVKTNLKQLDPNKSAILWFGHSSYLILAGGLTILVDPVFCNSIGPVPAVSRSFPGTSIYKPSDFPRLDAIIITHDHFDHLDFSTINALKEQTRFFYTALGVGAHLKAWGIPSHKIMELDWWENIIIHEHSVLTAAPARHFSGRSLRRNKTLWASFILEIDGLKLYLGGDSGYDTHFKEIGDQLGPFDLAILECGQYSEYWPFIHMMPEETAQASLDLKAKVCMPVHWGKFSLSLHNWKEPVARLVDSAQELDVKLAVPKIGEVYRLDQEPLPGPEWLNEVQ
jgi:L-ascorbate metabolism protein UlaG (beta-lactamase superfamily)